MTTEHDGQRNRSIDRWLLYWRPMELIAVFIIGLASGVVTTALLYRDHEKRILNYERWRSDHDKEDTDYRQSNDERIKVLERHTSQVSLFLEDKFHIRIP